MKINIKKIVCLSCIIIFWLLLYFFYSVSVMDTTQTKGWKEIHFAARDNSVDKIVELINLGIDVDEKANIGITPLWIASAYGSADAVKALVQNGANVNLCSG
ncbi:MAG: ankyrin repeat domain-containing protein, partial [Deltaproteobacteria bacterium]|nr:ankyrin repeat domain-containing protein [Deltaproteobacteria bacterium]